MRNISPPEDDPAAGALRLGDLLGRIGRMRSLRDPVAEACEGLQLTPPQIHTLLWLAEGPLTMGVLAKRLGVTEKTVTGVADRLERAGLVQRVRDEKDRRVIRLRLTRSGTSRSQKLLGNLMKSFEAFLKLFPPEDRRALLQILERLADRLEQTPSQDAPR
jgi:DNA-binding MarR family transcriptional regulator